MYLRTGKNSTGEHWSRHSVVHIARTMFVSISELEYEAFSEPERDIESEESKSSAKAA